MQTRIHSSCESESFLTIQYVYKLYMFNYKILYLSISAYN